MQDLFGDYHPVSARARVRFEPMGRGITVDAGTPLLEAARMAGLPVAQSCGGFAVCSWCKMRIVEGLENLSPAERAESKLMARQGFGPDERASCQALVLGDVTVTTTYW